MSSLNGDKRASSLNPLIRSQSGSLLDREGNVYLPLNRVDNSQTSPRENHMSRVSDQCDSMRGSHSSRKARKWMEQQQQQSLHSPASDARGPYTLPPFPPEGETGEGLMHPPTQTRYAPPGDCAALSVTDDDPYCQPLSPPATAQPVFQQRVESAHMNSSKDDERSPELTKALNNEAPSVTTGEFSSPHKADQPPKDLSSNDDMDGYNVLARAQSLEAKENQDSGDAASDTITSGRGGCCMQLGHTIKRVLTLMKREWCSTLCEFLIPIIFVLGTVLLWIIFGTQKGDATTYFSVEGPDLFNTAMSEVHDNMCYRSNYTAIGDLSVCDEHLIENKTYVCPEGRGIPAGLCYDAVVTKVASVIGGDTGVTIGVPSLDDMIVLHWLNMKDSSGVTTSGQLAALRSGGLLYFTPDTAETNSIVSYMRSKSVFFDLVFGGVYANPSDLETLIRDTTYDDPPNWGIIHVNSFSKSSFDVEIRLNASALPPTANPTDNFYLGGLDSNSGNMYILSGFTTLQTMLYTQYYTDVLGLTSSPPNLAYTPMPTPAYNKHKFISFGGELAPLILVLGYLYPVSQLTKRIVLEKELRIREAMLIMGLTEWIMYLAWFIIYFVFYFVSSLLMSIILRVTYLPNTDMGYMFFMLLFFSISTITLSGMLAALFSKARLAAILAPLIYFVMAIPLFAMENAGPSARTGILILSPSALAVGMDLIFEHESDGGAQASTLRYHLDNPNLLVVFAFLFSDIFVYLLLMLYFDQVIPKDWGTTRGPLFFIVDPIKWCFCRGGDDDDNDGEDGRAEDGVFEPIVDEENAAVRIRGLRKKFERGGKSFLAVNNLCWSLREGEISVLLGHNGAGKSTTMNLMTGMLPADAGDCVIYGRSIVKDLNGARQEIGLCPQHNILWPNLTVREHLDYFAAIKGLGTEEREAAVLRLLRAVDLEDKEHYMSSALSGGQKRKLSVAVAFVGGSRLVFLDEPTAGMDVGARRHTWGLLKQMARHHTILLSTHFMDEADLLGNTVAIMSHGRLQCSGTNMFLKSKLGVGFVLTMSVIAHVDRERIDSVVRSFVPDAESMGSGAGEVSYRLPMDSRQQFPALLAAIEADMAGLGVNAYSISATTLEEVFLGIANGEAQRAKAEADCVEAPMDDGNVANAVWDVKLEERASTLNWLQFRAMMIKRFWNALRDRRTQFFQIICPVACVLLAMLLTLVKFWNTPSIALNSNIYDETVEIPVAGCDSVLDLSTPFSSSANTIIWSDVSSAAGFDTKLADTYFHHHDHRFGGISCDAFTTNLSQTYQSVFYNSTAFHEVAIVAANYYNARLRYVIPTNTPTMVTYNNPMPKTNKEEAMKTSMYALMIAIIIMIPFTFIPSTFVGWIVKERECKARHLQNVSGLNFYIYWLSNFLFDIACYIITMFLVIAVFGIFNRQEYIGKKAIGATIVSFILYGISGIWMAYSLSFLFSSHSTAQNVVMLANFIAGFLLVLAVSALKMADSDITSDVANVLRWFFRIVPTYCIGESISNLAAVGMLNAVNQKKEPFDMSIIGWPCIYMSIEIPLFMFITLFVDHPGRRQRSQRLFHNPNATPEEVEDEDPDVIDEREEVLDGDNRSNDLVSVRHLRKEYPNGKVAVRNITFGVKPGEVFGFLGTNGAGKTTTISILCQEFYPTSGHASVCGYDIVENSQQALRCIGYCPQFDACLDLLTVEEHLYLYAGVRGISADTREGVVEGLMRLCELLHYRDTKSNELSGGNRRKLSVAISLIGGPRVVFLDEPSAGMDPVARRGLWNAIETVADNCSVVLTTHHLEEVEALAHRVAIMVDGTLRCIGDKTHLKQKYGTGFEVTVRVANESEASMDAVKAFFTTTFPSCELMEERSGRLTYQLGNDVKLSQVFGKLEQAQSELGITDYNVSQTSIEQVFMRISEEAEAKAEAEHQEMVDKQKEKKKSGCFGCCGN